MSTKAARKKGKGLQDGIAHLDEAGITLVPSLRPEATFEELRAFASDRIGEDPRRKGKTDKQIEQAIAQTMSALNRAKNHGGSASVRVSIEKELERAEEDARKGNRNPKRRASILLELLDELETQRHNEASSTLEVIREDEERVRRSPFGKSIVKSREGKGLSQTELAEKLGLCSATMSRWEHDTIPLDNDKTHAIVNEMEVVLGYGKDFQWGLIAGEGRLISDWPIEIPQDEWLRRKISERAGNLRGLSQAEQCAKRLAIYREIEAEDNEKVRFEPYSLGDFDKWPENALRGDWTELLQSHMTFEKLPDGEKPLVPPPDKTSPSFEVDRTTGNTLYMSGKPMREATASMHSQAASLIFGSCVNPIRMLKAKNETSSSDSSDTLGNEQDDPVKLQPILDNDELMSMGIALTICPEVIEHFFRAHRIMRDLLKKDDRLNRVHVRYVGTMKKIVEWIAQQPHFIERLKPIAGLLTAEQVADARRDWPAYCENVVKRYKKIYEGQKNRTAKRYDHGVEIEDLLVSEPQVALLAIFDSHADELVKFKERDGRRAAQLRDASAAGLKALCYYRPGTDHRLNWKADNTGHLRRLIEDGLKVWRMQVPKEDVKNHYSTAMKDGENRLLHDISGRFYACLEEYLDWGRAFLLADRTSDALIVRSSGRLRHSADSYGAYWKRLSQRAMKEDKPEFHGVRSMNCIQVREAGATDAFITDGTLEAAGKAINNTPQAAQVYVKVLASEHTKRSTERTKQADERRRLKRVG